MTTSQKTPLAREIESNAPLSKGALGYLCANTREAYFSYVHAKLASAEASGLKRKDVAARIGKTPTRLSHILGAPGNWTLDTITELLIAIGQEELIPLSLPILRDRPSNCSVDDILDHNTEKPTVMRIVWTNSSHAQQSATPSYVSA